MTQCTDFFDFAASEALQCWRHPKCDMAGSIHLRSSAPPSEGILNCCVVINLTSADMNFDLRSSFPSTAFGLRSCLSTRSALHSRLLACTMCLPVVCSPLDGGEDDLTSTEKLKTPSYPSEQRSNKPKNAQSKHYSSSTTLHATPDSDDFNITWHLDTLSKPSPLTLQERARFDTQMMPPPFSNSEMQAKNPILSLLPGFEPSVAIIISRGRSHEERSSGEASGLRRSEGSELTGGEWQSAPCSDHSMRLRVAPLSPHNRRLFMSDAAGSAFKMFLVRGLRDAETSFRLEIGCPDSPYMMSDQGSVRGPIGLLAVISLRLHFYHSDRILKLVVKRLHAQGLVLLIHQSTSV
ncbi:uncharacterized protein MYCFIDRAFT_176051 [Pseudocercospora fijiensis CIRAD86]|uniref:Uncharacterized protein n=1 Tax=Pseudocercospora fijiensis (strain CIRAD86) TaxID=383855 RepID=M2ZU21_PSEFD|nr:uncharacterized protein MYCFIDRAFT_176051 [Pseudocercospora fijiensis CIRAD86]EME82504.1 hypothetical protein MYCFIDRAFT_176051 [Pseudocercospora fijiensis CIRAD86]